MGRAKPAVPELAVTETSHGSGQADDELNDDELDVVQDLGDEIATLAAHLHAATYRLLTLIAEFDRLRGWEPGGHRSCAHWLAFRTGIDLGAAREKVRAARALAELPPDQRVHGAGRTFVRKGTGAHARSYTRE